MLRSIPLTSVLIVTLLSAWCAPLRASVYDDVTAWWHFDMAASGVVTTPGTIRDARAWYQAGGYVATSIQGTPEWTTVTASRGPAGGQIYGGRALSFNRDSGTDGFNISNLSVSGDATIFTRFNWDSTLSDPAAATLYFNGFNWSANQGWMLRLNGANGSPQLYYGSGKTATTGWTLTSGTWYDLAVVLKDNGATGDTINFYLYDAGGDIQSQQITVDWFDGAVAGTGTRVGYESNDYRYFGGQMESTALWNRALTYNEVRAAFGSPDSLWSLGINTDNNLNFRNESGSLPTTYAIGQPWGDVSRAVTQYGVSEFEVVFEATTEQAALPYVFHLDTDGVRDLGLPLTVSINGSVLGTKQMASNEDYTWYIEAGKLSTGTNTLRLEYIGPTVAYNDGGTYVTWDWMELAGSWQVGYDDNSQAEFRQESSSYTDDYYVTDANWQHLERAVTDGDPRIRLHFNLSDELANSPDDYYFIYTTEVIGQGDGLHPIEVWVNGTLLEHLPASSNNTVWSLDIMASLLNEGDNVIELRKGNIGSGGYAQFDFHRFEVMQVPEPAALAYLVLGLACLIGRRTRARR
ncbi:MAG: LamG-like jellyroll fold domain-containing protein [Patescibacteria group bacterium]|nr:LamG-like jellyroll fold domain-containing protein [Patescibacteria group bacterium]